MSRITLNGYVVADDDKWIYDWFDIGCFCPAMVRQAIQDNPEGETLELEINSFGGSVFAGFEIYSILRGAKCGTTALVQSIAASAASTVILGCDRILLSPVAQVMIHLPETSTDGNREDHLESVRILDGLKESILNGYQVRCGDKATRDQLSKLINEATWLPAQDAIALGLADGLMFAEAESAELPLSIVNSVGVGIRAIAGSSAAVPDAGTLRAQYYQRVAAGEKPAEGHPASAPNSEPAGGAPVKMNDDWRNKARLDIENYRF